VSYLSFADLCVSLRCSLFLGCLRWSWPRFPWFADLQRRLQGIRDYGSARRVKWLDMNLSSFYFKQWSSFFIQYLCCKGCW